MTYAQMLALLAGLTSTNADVGDFAQLKSGGYDRAIPVTIKACPQPIGQNEIEGQTIVCGTVSVPEDHGAPDGRRVDLFFVVLKSHSSYPEPDPLIYLHGGPGAGTLGNIGYVAKVFDAWRVNRDVVMFDQRAAGLSSTSVTCFDALSSGFFDFLSAAANKELQPEPAAGPNPMLRDCLAELKAQGIDISKYNTYQNALDVRSIVTALGYKTYNLYGGSYGTKLSLEVMRTIPDGVRAVILDGVAPPRVKLYDTFGLPLDEAMTSVVDECAADTACNTAYPNLGEVLKTVLKKAAAEELVVKDAKVPALIALLPFMVRNGQKTNTSLTSYIPAYVYELYRDKETPTVDMLSSKKYELPLPGEAEVRTTAKGLTADQKGLVNSALADIAIGDKANADLGQTVRQLTESIQRSTIQGPIAALFDQELGKAVLASLSEDKSKLKALILDYAAMQNVAPSKTALLAFVDKYFTGDARDRLGALVAAMTDAEVDASFDIIRRDTYKYEAGFIGNLDLYIYSCQEDMPYNSLEGYKQVTAGLNYPEIGAAWDAKAAGYYADCSLFAPQPRPGFHDPIVSDIPTLALGSIWDTQTAASWAPLAVETLSHGQAFIIPEAGHGALLYQKCAVDMGVAFINDPTRKLDDRCPQSIKPKFYIAPWVEQ